MKLLETIQKISKAHQYEGRNGTAKPYQFRQSETEHSLSILRRKSELPFVGKNRKIFETGKAHIASA